MRAAMWRPTKTTSRRCPASSRLATRAAVNRWWYGRLRKGARPPAPWISTSWARRNWRRVRTVHQRSPERFQADPVIVVGSGRHPQTVRQAEGAQGADDNALGQEAFKDSRCFLLGGQHHHHKVRFRRHQAEPRFPQAFGQVFQAARVEFKRAVQELPISKRGNAGRLRRRGGLERQLYLEQVANQFLVREPITDPSAGEAVDLGERAQSDHVVVAVLHRIRVARVVFGVFEIGFVEDNQHALWNVAVELVELVAGEDRAGRVVRVRQIDNFRLGIDGLSERGQVVVPFSIGDCAVHHSARPGQHLKTDEGGFRGEDFILVTQKGADDVGHDAFGAGSGDDVVYLEIEFLRQHFAQTEPAVGIKIQALERTRDGFERLGRSSERVLVGRELGDPAQAVLLADRLRAAPRLIGPQGFDIGRNEWQAVLLYCALYKIRGAVDAEGSDVRP